MKRVDLEALKAREKAASPGPWEGADGQITAHSDKSCVKQKGAFDWVLSMQISNCPNWKADEEFIAHSRQDIPALITEVEALRGLERAARGLKAHTSPAHRCSSECKMIVGVLEAINQLPPLEK